MEAEEVGPGGKVIANRQRGIKVDDVPAHPEPRLAQDADRALIEQEMFHTISRKRIVHPLVRFLVLDDIPCNLFRRGFPALELVSAHMLRCMCS